MLGWLRCGVYDEPVPDEFAVRSIEHDAIWPTYRPGTPADQVARLTELDCDDVLVTPDEGH